MVALLTNTDDAPPTPDQARMIKRVKWLMLLSGFATMLGIVVVLIVADYRLFHSPAPSGGASADPGSSPGQGSRPRSSPRARASLRPRPRATR